MLLISGKLIVGKYVAESITTDCRTFQPCRPLTAAYKHNLQKMQFFCFLQTLSHAMVYVFL